MLRTDDMTLATYLTLEGFTPALVKVGERRNGNPIGAWDFPAECEGLKERFEAGQAGVEPQAFHRELNRTRSRLFEFLQTERTSS